MRTNNAKVKNVIISVYFILIVFAIFLATVFSAFKDLTDNAFLTFLIVAGVFLLILFSVHFVSRYFEYDSDGEKVIIMNKGLLLADHFNYREKRLEFAKEELIRFKFYNFYLYKTLFVQLRDAKGRKRRERFNVTLVTKKKRKYIKQSLSKMIKYNRKLYNE